MSLNEFNFCWKIENYLLWDRINGGRISTPDILVTNGGHYYYVHLYPKGIYDNFEGCVSLDLVGDISEITDFNVRLCDADDKVIVECDETKGVRLTKAWFGFYKMVKFEELEKKMKESSNDCLIVRCKCRMKPNSDVRFVLEKSKTIKTTIKFDKYSFDWDINFDISSDTLMKKIFTHMNNSKFETVVKAPDDEILIEIRRLGTYTRSDKVKCQIFLIDYTETEILSSWDNFLFDHKSIGGNVWHFPPFFKKSSLPKDEGFELRFNFFISNGRYHSIYIEDTKAHEHKYLNKICDNPVLDSLQDDYHAMFSSNKYTDVKLLMNKGTITAHKIILASRSPVFSAMFDHQDMTESHTGEIKIADIDADTMKLFLKFLYTGILDKLDSKRILKLLLAAERYQVPSLKEKCSQFLTSHLNAYNICDVASVADMVGHEILKAAAIDYIKEHTEDVLGSPKWPKGLEKNVRLGSEIIFKISNMIRYAK